jgi:hypothetical protein
MFLLALSLGLRPFYTIRPEGEALMPNGKVSPQKQFHCITFYGDDAQMLAHRLGVQPPPRSKTKVSGFFQDGLFWRRVLKVSRFQYQGPVYNMRTSTEEYVAGLLLTHNCFGHWHKDQGVQEIDGTKFINIGSLTRGSLSQDNVKRRPAIALLTIDRETGIRIQVLRIRVKDAEEVFDMESRVREEARDMTVDAFVESVREALVVSKSDSVEESIGSMVGVPEVVRERALGFMELVE